MNNKKLKIAFINVGNGDSIYIEYIGENQGLNMLIDGGSGEAQEYEMNSTGRITAAEWLNKHGVTKLDVMVNTHIHEDHTCGLNIIAEKLKPSEFWQPFSTNLHPTMKYTDVSAGENESRCKFITSINSYKSLCELVSGYGGKICRITRNTQPVCIDNSFKIKFLGPTPNTSNECESLFNELNSNGIVNPNVLTQLDASMNDSSIMLIIEFAGKRILLSGDTGNGGYNGIEEKINTDIFKVGHHGQINGLDEKLLKSIAPEYVVICASSDRRYNSAAPELLKLVDDFGAAIIFTDCPNVQPYTEGLKPHNSSVFEIDNNGKISFKYENV